jgi:hypothetical protein
VAFQKSRHYQLLKTNNPNGPTCVTCHDEVGADRPSPKSLQSQCLGCHGADKLVPQPEVAAHARRALEGIRLARARLREARSLLSGVQDKARRTTLETLAQQAEVPLIQATEAGHQFVFDELEERLSVAERRITDLRGRLANPEAHE